MLPGTQIHGVWGASGAWKVSFKQGLGHSQFMGRERGPEHLECDR